ncbi:MAG: 2-keto-4-pentenoate hydratase [Hydrogenophilaceae bacterium]|nr:2-keto-4-pentenoate hydratase [Hydrogenophilaceae bacterium]
MTEALKRQFSPSAIAGAFVEARRLAQALAAYPGVRPTTLAEAYAVQDAAIALWPDAVAGWKIGLVPPDQRAAVGADRIAGPIFTRQVQHAARAGVADLPVIRGGFSAVEAEFVFRIGADAPTDRRAWTPIDAAALPLDLHIGVECAGSPLAAINDLGAAVTASDFGNNAGLVVGQAIPDWRKRAWSELTAQTFIDDVEVGAGAAAALPGGPFSALAFILEHAAARGRPLRAGQWISTGAVTGVHRIAVGQRARCVFDRLGEVSCRMVEAVAGAGAAA